MTERKFLIDDSTGSFDLVAAVTDVINNVKKLLLTLDVSATVTITDKGGDTVLQSQTDIVLDEGELEWFTSTKGGAITIAIAATVGTGAVRATGQVHVTESPVL